MVKTIEEKFNEFHKENPEVYKQLVSMSRQLKVAGHKKCGMKMLFEILRWRSMLKTQGDEYKLPNNYTSRYARLIMENEPGLEGFFETRSLQTA